MAKISNRSLVRKVMRASNAPRQYDWGPFASDERESSISEDREADKDGNYMSIQNMKDIHTISGELSQKIQAGDGMEDWVEDKISAARQILSDLERFYNKGWASKENSDLQTRKSSEHWGDLWYQNNGTARGRTTFEVIIEWEDDKYLWDKRTQEVRRNLDKVLADTLTKFLKKNPNLPNLGELEHYPVTTRGRTTREVIIEWNDGKGMGNEARKIQRDLDDALGNALSKFLNKQPNLQ